MLDDPETYEAIGRVAVAAATLEHHLAHLVALARGHDDAWLRSALVRPREVRDELKRLCTDVEHGPFRDELTRLRRDAVDALETRHAVIHSVVVMDLAEDGGVPWNTWHPKSDRQGPLDSDAIRDCATRLQTLGARAIVVSQRANEWRERRAEAPDAL